MVEEKQTVQQQTVTQPTQTTSISPTIDVNGVQINRNDLIGQVEGQYNSFFNTYKDMWSKKQQKQILDQKNAIVNNIQNGNITKITNSNIDVSDINNSGIDTTMNGAGQINIEYLTKIGKWMSDQVIANTPHKKFDSSTLNNSWMNNFFGGSDTPDYQSWLDLDTVDKNGKRGTNGRIAALSNWLNNFDINSYTETNDALGNLENVKAKFNRLRTALNDGTLNNKDYAAASALGFNLRTILAGNIGSSEDASTSDNADDNTVDSSGNQPTDAASIIQNAWNGGNPQTTVNDLAKIINSWKSFDDVIARIGKAPYSSANDYLRNRNRSDRSGVYNVHDANSMVNYYANNFFPKFFDQFKLENFSPEYVAKHINETVPTWYGNASKYKYIAQNLTLAIKNKQYGGGTLLGSLASQLNNLGDGFWTVPGSFNETRGSIYVYNPDNGEFKRISIRNPKYVVLMRDYLVGKGVNLSDQSQPQSQKNGGKLNKLQYGGNIIPQQPSQPIVDLSTLMAPTPQQIAAQQKQAQQVAQQKAAQQKAQQKAKYWKGNEGKEFHSASEFWNSLTPQDRREVYASGLDLASIAFNIGGAVSAAPTDGIGAIVGGVGSAVTGLGAAALRTYNRAADGDFTLGDIGSSALDAGMALTGLIPGIGAAAKTGSIAAKFGKVAHIVMAGLGGLGLLESYPGAKRAAENILANKMPSTSDLQSFTSAITMLSGHASYRGAKVASNRMLAHAAQSGRIKNTSAKPESWTYKFNLKDANGALKPQKITLQTKQQVTTLKNAIKGNKAEDVLGVIKGADNRFKDAKVEDLSFTPMSKTEKLKSLKSDNVAGITHTKATQGGEEILAYDNPQNLEQIMWNISQKGATKANDLFPNINSIRSLLLGPSRKSIIENNMPHAQESVHTQTEATQQTSPVQEQTPTQTPPTQEPIVQPEAAPVTNERGFVIVAHGPIETPTKPQRQVRQTTILPPTTNKKPNDPNFALLGPTESKIQSLFLPGKDINKTNLIDFINKNKTLYNKLSKKDKQFIDDLTSPNLFNEPASEEVRKHLLDVATKMITPKQGVTWRKQALDANTKALSMIRYGNGGIVKAQTGTNTSTFQPQVFGKVKGRTNYGGITNTNNNTSWYNNVFTPYHDYILGQLKTYGNEDTYGNWLNDMQHQHAGLYKSAGGQNGNFLNVAYNNNADATRKYQSAYDTDSLSKDPTTHGYNTRGIALASQAGRYKNVGYKTRNGQDSLKTNWTPDGSYSGQTDDRRILGRLGDYTDSQLKDWNTQLNSVGWEQYLDPSDNYYKLRRWNNPNANQNNSTVAGTDPGNGPKKSNILGTIANVINQNKPAILGALRTGWDNRFNNKQLNTYLSHLHPVLYDPWQFNRRIYGDYGTMNEYNRQGARAELQASRIASNTADSYLGAASQMQGASQASDLAIEGRLADNQMIRNTYEKSLLENKANLEIANSVANQNKLNLNNNERERTQAILSTNTMNHNNWERWFQGYVELPVAQQAKEKKAMQNYLDYANIMNEATNSQNRQIRDIRNKYMTQYDNATSDKQRSQIARQMQDEIQEVQTNGQRDILSKLAQLRGLNYNYTPTWKPSGTYSTATPTYKANGGTLYAVTQVRERNKDNDRLSKQWRHSIDKFWNQFGKMKQADYSKIIKIR